MILINYQNIAFVGLLYIQHKNAWYKGIKKNLYTAKSQQHLHLNCVTL
jgi:hypothetical protein